MEDECVIIQMFFSFGCFVSQIIYCVHCSLKMSLKWHLLLNTVSSLSDVCLFGVLGALASE